MIQKYAPIMSDTPLSALVQSHVVHSGMLIDNNWDSEQET